MLHGLLRLILLPIRLVLGLLIFILSILVGIGKAVLYFFMGLCLIIGLGMLFVGSGVLGVQLLLVAFLLSPLGIPLIGTAILGFLKGVHRAIKYI